MLAMHYRIPLPADYDMAVIRERVSRGGPLLDDYAGLGLKAFLVREKGVDGSPVNEYAPFYLWSDTAGAASFLWGGDGFGGIVRDFGRPAVHTWIGGSAIAGPARDSPARYAVRVVEPLPADVDPAAPAAAVEASLSARRSEDGLHTLAYGIDPASWQLVTFALHGDRPDPRAGELFQVLHLSAPALDALPAAVHSRQRIAR
ncbi:DUF4865 family protein [Naasia sp. SYSU D00057]|uniref:DUF4865 family protein n=1 Tax=Naasia sp. SYSU D00057 TaxID=2817380 RepID=UPI001B3034A5|nr:DUF4865 family protein [Naasia sp. SYSU D00057]